MSKQFHFSTFALIAFFAIITFFPGCSGPKTNIDKMPNEFTETREEQKLIEFWNKKTFEQTATVAFEGDPAAAYVAGMRFLLGIGGPVDTFIANKLFSLGARVGFGPALHKIQFMYMEDLPDSPKIFLANVYLNLTIASGHQEEFRKYEKIKELIRNELGQQKGNRIIMEIERIANHKNNLIEKNRKLSRTVDPKANFISHTEDLLEEDLLFDDTYWNKVANGKAPENLAAWLDENVAAKIERAAQQANTMRDHFDDAH